MKRGPQNESRRGNCYVACEALYHLLGGKEAGWVPHTVHHEGSIHWYLVHRDEPEARTRVAKLETSIVGSQLVLDPTVSQFKTKPNYWKGRGRGFLTKEPSRRAQALMEKMVWQ